MTPIYVSFFTVGNGYESEARQLGQTLNEFGLPADLVGVPPFSNWTEACAYKPIFLLSMRRKHGPRPLVWLDADARVRAYPELFLKMPAEVDFAAHWRVEQESGVRSQESGKATGVRNQESVKPIHWVGEHPDPDERQEARGKSGVPPERAQPAAANGILPLASSPLASHSTPPGELLSGTLYFGPTAAADRLLTQWAAGCIQSPDEWDQRVLQKIVEEQASGVRDQGASAETQLTPGSCPLTPALKILPLPAPYTLIFDTMRDQGPPVIEHMQASRRLRK